MVVLRAYIQDLQYCLVVPWRASAAALREMEKFGTPGPCTPREELRNSLRACPWLRLRSPLLRIRWHCPFLVSRKQRACFPVIAERKHLYERWEARSNCLHQLGCLTVRTKSTRCTVSQSVSQTSPSLESTEEIKVRATTKTGGPRRGRVLDTGPKPESGRSVFISVERWYRINNEILTEDPARCQQPSRLRSTWAQHCSPMRMWIY